MKVKGYIPLTDERLQEERERLANMLGLDVNDLTGTNYPEIVRQAEALLQEGAL